MRMRKTEFSRLVLFLVVVLTMGVANTNTATGLVGHWAFEEGAGPTAYDSSGNGYDGTLKGTPTWDSGPEGFDGALLFDAGSSGDGVECGTACDPGDVFTLAIWAYWNGNPAPDGTSVHFMTKGNSWNVDDMRWQWELWVGNVGNVGDLLDKVGISCAGFGSIALTADAMPANEWVHLAITFDGTNAALFINGVADPLGPQAFAIGTKTNAMFYIGVDNGYKRSFDGYLDEARVYSRVLSQSDIQMLMVTDKAVNIEPRNGVIHVPIDTNLSWGPPPTFTPEKYDLLYKIGDPNFAPGAPGTVYTIEDITRTDPCNVYDPPADFAYNTTIYWRVDSYWPGASDPCMGDVWNFTTMPEWPVILEDPCSLTVAAGDTAVFRVKDINGVSYVWKRQRDNETVGGNSPVLTLTNVQEDPCEDFYRCIVSKSGFDDAASAWATLWTKRLIARWEFEDNLNDSEAGGWDGFYTDPCAANPSPTAVYVSGLEGQALQLTADKLHVRITDSEDFFNFYPLGYTVNAWVRTGQVEVYGCIASKQYRSDNHPEDSEGWVLNCTDTGKAVSSLRQVDAAVSTTDINDDQWHMVTGTYDAEAGVVAVYVDGKLDAESEPSSDVAPTNVYPVVLGAETVFAELSVYEGLLDKTSIYSYALGPVEVAVLYTDVAGGDICLEYPEYDFNEDCEVDLQDFAVFAADWLKCNLVPDCLP